MKYSIIITAFNTAEYIEQCLDSVCSQDYKGQFEVLLGIDACDDTLKKVIKIIPKYSNLKVFMNQTNAGTYITRNTLYQYANGSHIVQFDSDDIMIKTLLTELDPLANKFDVVKFMGQNFRGKENIGRPKEMCSPGIYKRWIYDTFGGYDSWKIVADSEFNHRIKPFTKKIMKLKVVMKRRLHESSLMALHPPSEQYRTEEKNRIQKNPTEIKRIEPKTTICYQVL